MLNHKHAYRRPSVASWADFRFVVLREKIVECLRDQIVHRPVEVEGQPLQLPAHLPREMRGDRHKTDAARLFIGSLVRLGIGCRRGHRHNFHSSPGAAGLLSESSSKIRFSQRLKLRFGACRIADKYAFGKQGLRFMPPLACSFAACQPCSRQALLKCSESPSTLL